jgi:FtsZ-interacting cell division protein ZipA
MIKHRFFQLLKKINIEILLILVLIVVLVALLFYNNVNMENMTINIYADSKGYKINEVKEEKEEKEDTSNVKPYTKNNDDASDYPSELKEIIPNIAELTSEENTSADKKETKENTDAKKDSVDSIAKRTSKYIDTFTAPITAEPPPP